MFDTNNDQAINFREFLIGLATFANESVYRQIKLSFKIYDPDGTGKALKSDVREILADLISNSASCFLP